MSLAFSKYAQAQWKANVEIYAKPGDERSYTGVDAVVPVWQDARSLGFADLKFKLGTSNSQEYNLGAGYRSYLKDNDTWAYGIYGAWDRRRAPDSGNDFNQFTVGAELRSAVWDFRGNYYAPQTEKKVVGLGSSQFAGFGVFRNGVFEEAMRGWDVEAGGRLPFSGLGEMRAYIAAYQFKGDDVAPKTSGTRVRLEYSPRQDWTVGLSAQDDALFGSAVFLEVRYSFGKPASTAKKMLKDRMIDPWVRDVDIAISPAIESRDPRFWQTVQASGAVHVDSSKPAGGDGSFERPYDTTTACFSEKCGAVETSVIRVWQGNSPSTPYASVALLPGQTFWGQGVDIYTGEASPGLRPTIGTGGTAITLASNTTVAGVQTNGAIVGNNVFGSVTIRNSLIENAAGAGISISNSGNGTANIAVANNIINTAGGAGIYVANFAGSGETAQQTVTLSANTITSTNGSGIVVTNRGKYGGTASQTATVSGNTIVASGSGAKYGIAVRNFAFDSGSTANQTATLSGNTIAVGGTGTTKYAGISAYNLGTYGAASQTLTLTGNTIAVSGTGSKYTGTSLLNWGKYGGAATQTATLSGNTISAGTGVLAMNLSGYGPLAGGNATQSVVLSGNNISAIGNKYGYGGTGFFNYASNGGTATQNVTLTGNTISGVDNAVVIVNYENSAIATQNATLSSNTLNASGPSSVGVAAYSKYSGQSVVLQGNTINAATPVYNSGAGSCTVNGAACPAPVPSDRRLKRDIVHLATLESGIRIYAFRYLWSDEMFVGVMAQDLLAAPAHSAAVTLTRGNFYVVDYHALGLKMITLGEWLRSPGNVLAREGRGLPATCP